ncbi:hypothetical protein LTR37_021133 [Vermiconidia calcicola]|uniref:Uncharacterized protein n=1 Tax=Vermiconidia calcicola TaxID=1690605 RepID=A0ACC3M9L1_9PEZI|nr:hypothetical protein LTR37_021133 [Vermiconidia calcicola]
MPGCMKHCLALGAITALVHASPIAKEDVQSMNAANLVVRNLLVKRSVTGVSCGQFATADEYDARDSAYELQFKAGNAEFPSKGCSRVGCYDTSGFYVCNDQDVAISVPLLEVGTALSYVAKTCTGDIKGISGQAFVDTFGGFNVIVAVCVSSDPVDTTPASYIPPGVNGASARQCGGNSGIDCPSSSTCDKDTFVMTSQTAVTCNEYMAPAYIGPGGIYSYSTSRSITKGWSSGRSLGIDSSDLAKASAQASFFFLYTDTTTTGSIAGSNE